MPTTTEISKLGLDLGNFGTVPQKKADVSKAMIAIEPDRFYAKWRG